MSSQAAMRPRAALLGCIFLAIVAAPVFCAGTGDADVPGRKTISLVGRRTCLRRGDLAASQCGASDSLNLFPGGTSKSTTWLLEAAPGALRVVASGAKTHLAGLPVTLKVLSRSSKEAGGCPRKGLLTAYTGCDNKAVWMGAGSRWVLEPAGTGVKGQYRIRSQGRSTGSCHRIYLGAIKASASRRKDCGSPGLAVYAKDDANVLTVWQISHLPDPLPPPPPRPTPPPPSRIPPPVARTSPPPPTKRTSPPPVAKPSPPPPTRTSPPPPPVAKPSLPPPTRTSPPPPPPLKSSPSPPPPPPSPPPPLPPPPSPSPPPPSPPPPSQSPPPPSPSPPPPSPPPPSPSPPPPSPPPPSPSPPPPSPSPPPPSPPPPLLLPPPPKCIPYEQACIPQVDSCCQGYCDSGAKLCVCFPASATVATADRGRVAMPDLRPGDRVLSVGWDGRLRYEEIYMFTRFDPAAMGAYINVHALGAGAAGQARSHHLKLSPIHYMASSLDPSGACAALAAGGGAAASQELQAAWTAAAQGLDWQRDHVMRLANELSPGMVAWLADPANPDALAAPACIFGTNTTLDAGAFSPFVRARGIVVDGMVASPHVRWGRVWGRLMLPAALDPHVPAIMDRLLTPFYLLYKALGPALVWRITRLPLLGSWGLGNVLVGNLAVWGQLAALLAAGACAGRMVHTRRRTARAAAKCKAE